MSLFIYMPFCFKGWFLDRVYVLSTISRLLIEGVFFRRTFFGFGVIARSSSHRCPDRSLAVEGVFFRRTFSSFGVLARCPIGRCPDRSFADRRAFSFDGHSLASVRFFQPFVFRSCLTFLILNCYLLCV